MSLGVDRICVVIGRTRHRMMEAELQAAAEQGAKFVELRIDFLARSADLRRLLKHKRFPLIATIRRHSDGGRWSGTEDERRMLMRQCIAGGDFDWVDIETDIADSIPRFGSVKRIVSYHNLDGTPDDLEAIYERMCKQDADVVKIAVTAQSQADNIRILNLLKSAPKPTVAHCMGEIGFPSRILALKYGAPFIYAAFNKERNVAPGLPSFRDLQQIYPVQSIDSLTRVYGVAGDPVGHSLSPQLHNRMFRKLDVNAVYLPFRIPRNRFSAVVKELDAIPIEGYSVTIPHKEWAAGEAKECDPTVKSTRAANTMLRLPSGGFRASNTDFTAVVECLAAQFGAAPADSGFLKGKVVMLLGAGGAARAVGHAASQAGASVHITSRTFERAQRLAEEIDGKAIDWKARHNGECQILINATPIGMHPAINESPIHVSYLQPELVVFDTVYTPENTRLIKEARARGCPVITGVEMFVRQAALQFQLFTGIVPDLDDMRETLRRAISPVTRSAE